MVQKTAVPIKIIRTGICMDLAIASVSDSGNVFCRTDIRPFLAICELLSINIV